LERALQSLAGFTAPVAYLFLSALSVSSNDESVPRAGSSFALEGSFNWAHFEEMTSLPGFIYPRVSYAELSLFTTS